jgi:hypothetical protein
MVILLQNAEARAFAARGPRNERSDILSDNPRLR